MATCLSKFPRERGQTFVTKTAPHSPQQTKRSVTWSPVQDSGVTMCELRFELESKIRITAHHAIWSTEIGLQVTSTEDGALGSLALGPLPYQRQTTTGGALPNKHRETTPIKKLLSCISIQGTLSITAFECKFPVDFSFIMCQVITGWPRNRSRTVGATFPKNRQRNRSGRNILFSGPQTISLC